MYELLFWFIFRSLNLKFRNWFGSFLIFMKKWKKILLWSHAFWKQFWLFKLMVISSKILRKKQQSSIPLPSDRDYILLLLYLVKKTSWKFLKHYTNSISNVKLNINLYYKFSKKIPPSYVWHSIGKSKMFIPSFTKKIFKQVSVLF